MQSPYITFQQGTYVSGLHGTTIKSTCPESETYFGRTKYDVYINAVIDHLGMVHGAVNIADLDEEDTISTTWGGTVPQLLISRNLNGIHVSACESYERVKLALKADFGGIFKGVHLGQVAGNRIKAIAEQMNNNVEQEWGGASGTNCTRFALQFCMALGFKCDLLKPKIHELLSLLPRNIEVDKIKRLLDVQIKAVDGGGQRYNRGNGNRAVTTTMATVRPCLAPSVATSTSFHRGGTLLPRSASGAALRLNPRCTQVRDHSRTSSRARQACV